MLQQIIILVKPWKFIFGRCNKGVVLLAVIKLQVFVQFLNAGVYFLDLPNQYKPKWFVRSVPVNVLQVIMAKV